MYMLRRCYCCYADAAATLPDIAGHCHDEFRQRRAMAVMPLFSLLDGVAMSYARRQRCRYADGQDAATRRHAAGGFRYAIFAAIRHAAVFKAITRVCRYAVADAPR